MGYTHYWYRPPTLEQAPFARFVRDVATLIRHLPATALDEYHGGVAPLVIRGPMGDSVPQLTSELVALNGDAATDCDHETFYVERVMKPDAWNTGDAQERYFACCKTAAKPYDLLVCAALLAFRHHFPQARVASDGGGFEWAAGVALYQSVFSQRALPGDGPWNNAPDDDDNFGWAAR